MANNIVSTAVFTPFTFDEMVKPLEMYRQYYNTNEKAINDLAEKTGKWENFISQENDPDLYNTTRSYTKDLMDKANILANEGMSPSLKREISSMRDRYNTDIKPIEDAYKKREALQTQQYKKMMTDDSVMFDKDYNSMSLSDMMKPENTGYKTVIGKNLMKEAKDLGAELSKRQVRAAVNNALDPNIENLSDMLGKYHMLGQYFGYDNQQVTEVLNNIENNQAFQKIYNDLYNTRDINLLSPKDQERAKNYILTGLAQGLTYKQSLTPYSRSVGSSGRSSGGSRGGQTLEDKEKADASIHYNIDTTKPDWKKEYREVKGNDLEQKQTERNNKQAINEERLKNIQNKNEMEYVTHKYIETFQNDMWGNPEEISQSVASATKEKNNYGISLNEELVKSHEYALKNYIKNRLYTEENLSFDELNKLSPTDIMDILKENKINVYIDKNKVTFVPSGKVYRRKKPLKKQTSFSSNLGQTVGSSDTTKTVNSASLGAFTNPLKIADQKAPLLNVNTDFLNKE